MNTFDRISEDIKDSMKSGDKTRLGVLRLISSAIKNKEIELKRPLEETELTQILRTQAKQRNESILAFEKGDRADLAKVEKAELTIIQEYLPEELAEAEITKIVQTIIAETSATQADFGRVMGMAMKKIGSAASGNRVSNIVKNELK